jgi:hypothetical protein
VTSGDLDAASFSTWSDGAERTEELLKTAPGKVLWTRDGRPDWPGVEFGQGKNPGPRHLRIGLKTTVPAGAVLARGGGALSVLKPEAPFPGDLANEAHWLAAERLTPKAVAREQAGREEYVVWTLPPGTQTRALRFTHIAQPADPKYDGWLGGAVILPERVANLAPHAVAAARARDEAAGAINNGREEHWNAWDNGKEGGAQPVSREHAETVTLVWPQPVALSGLMALWPGFSSAEVQTYTGAPERHPREAGDSDWRTIGSFDRLAHGYPHTLWPNALAFPETVTTRAVRLRITAPAEESHGHMKGKTKDGRRIWLGELLALTPLAGKPLASALPPAANDEAHPPIPVRFTLPEAGYVTLVIEDTAGKRVRNLVSEAPFPKGQNIAWWDGTDDLGRDQDAARHGLWHIPGQPVAPGTYRVRGLWHRGLELRYEFSIYNAGNPAWETEDKTGGWLTNHTPPQAALFLPATKSPSGKPMVYLGSAISEGGSGLAWVDLEGKKLGGRGWIGGNWTAAPHLARDDGSAAAPGVVAYVGATWSSKGNEDKTDGELRITALTDKGDKPIIKHPFTPPAHAATLNANGDEDHWISQLGGIAVRDGVLVASMHRLGRLLFIDAQAGKVTEELEVESPRGAAFDAQGRLLILSGTRLLRRGKALEPVITSGLEDPQGLTLDSAGNLYVSDHGASHQVKVFTPDGKLLRTLGKAGAPKAGLYDPQKMHKPHGVAVDERGCVWVAENDFQPKRVSLWAPDGAFIRAFYGPARYGGGGALDPADRTRFYYDGIEFRLDWEAGTSEPAALIHRPGPDDLQLPRHSGAPERAIRFERRQYMTDCFNSNPTNGGPTAGLWQMKGGVAKPVALLGRASEWELLKGAEFKVCWPPGMNPQGDRDKNAALFAWSDLNDDALAQPAEVSIVAGASGGITVQPDLSFLASRWGEKAMRWAPVGFTPGGAPRYDLARGEVLTEGAQTPASSGGDQAIISPDDWTVLTVGPKPFARESLAGARGGVPLWSIPSPWPGLHASHEAAVPSEPGQIIGHTRLLGPFVQSAAGPLWGINANMGNMYLLTADGLFVSELFEDVRKGKLWTMPTAQRGMKLENITLHDENFFPSLTQTTDGRVYLQDGARQSLVRIDGLENLARLPDAKLEVTAAALAGAATWRVQAEAQRQAARGTGRLIVALRKDAPVVDGKLEDWADADWAVIDRRGVAANFNSDSKPYDITGAVAISGDRLFAAWRTQDAELLKNSNETALAPFKHGGALDLMFGADPAADPKRTRPVAGDARLLVTRAGEKTLALLYRAVVPGTREPVPFVSPVRRVTLDRVDDLSAEVLLATSTVKNERGKVTDAYYELSIPLARLGLAPAAGQAIQGDIGILRGNGFQTLQRVYWNNKATGITSDVPSEAELLPALWGRWEFRAR